MIASDSNGNGQAPAAPVDADERVKGVTWDRTNERWVVKLTRDDITYFLGAYRDKQHALGIRMEAERLPAEDFPRLRERYRQMAGHKRGRKVQQPATPPDHLLEEKPRQDNGQQNSDQVSEADSSSPDEQRLVTLIARARAADERMQRLARESVVAATAAEKAEQEAVAAWNVVAEAIAALGGRKPAHSHDLSSQG